MMFNNLGLYSPRRFLRKLRPLQPVIPCAGQIGGNGNDIFYNGSGSEGPPGPAGANGVSVTDAYVSENPGDLFITLSDGTVINAGNVIGPPGPPGPGSTGIIPVILVDLDYTALASDYYIGAIEKNITVTLPLGVVGKVYIVKNQSNGNTKVNGTSGQKLDSDSFKTLGSESSIICVFDGTRWNTI